MLGTCETHHVMPAGYEYHVLIVTTAVHAVIIVFYLHFHLGWFALLALVGNGCSNFEYTAFSNHMAIGLLILLA